MTQTIIWTVAILSVLGLLLALILFWVARRFKVEEDPRIDEVEKVMPGANCGGCGLAGCRAFADTAVKALGKDKPTVSYATRPARDWESSQKSRRSAIRS